jgi:hypothetical protein
MRLEWLVPKKQRGRSEIWHHYFECLSSNRNSTLNIIVAKSYRVSGRIVARSFLTFEEGTFVDMIP